MQFFVQRNLYVQIKSRTNKQKVQTKKKHFELNILQ